ncbi:MAG: 50S ribosomal protein L11 methyltransferase [Nitrospirae bacterium]|nr:50S ribosomal protein L11 methyltransferase [Nitrospirota bacterium]
MAWLQISLISDPDNLERVEEALTEAGALAITLMHPDGKPLFIEGSRLLNPGNDPFPIEESFPFLKGGKGGLFPWVRITGLFDAGLDIEIVRRHLMSALKVDFLPGLEVESLEDRAWALAWMDYFRPMPFGKRLWVCPEGYDFPDPHAVNIVMNPGQAFGTGTHPTTALCLEWIEGADLEGLDVIDYGCGSGILAIAAAKLGARHVWAVDDDPQALVTAQENVRRNDVDATVSILPPESPGGLQADVIVANILARPLIALAPRFAGLLHPGGRVVLSGILQDQADEVAQAYRSWFHMEPPVARDPWVRIEGRLLKLK